MSIFKQLRLAKAEIEVNTLISTILLQVYHEYKYIFKLNLFIKE